MHTPQKWVSYLNDSKSYFKKANHLAYVTITLLKENRLLIKILLDLHQSTISLIKAYLDYEASQGAVVLSKDSHKNLNLFIGQIAPKYLKEEQVENMIRILKIARQHKDAPLEFVKKTKFVIFNNGNYETVTAENIKAMISSLSQSISSFPGK